MKKFDRRRKTNGQEISAVEIFDPQTYEINSSQPMLIPLQQAAAVAFEGKIYIFGGHSSGNINKTFEFNPVTNTWLERASMPTARRSPNALFYNSRIWVIGGSASSNLSVVESYDPVTNSWRTESSLSTERGWASAWLNGGTMNVSGGRNLNDQTLSTIETYNLDSNTWVSNKNLPIPISNHALLEKNNTLYQVGGISGTPTNKVFAADLNASVEGVYDLYRKDGDAPVGTPVVQSEYADGSVTGSKMADGAITTDKLNEQILKYLKPEITSQPLAQTVYGDSNISFSVIAEGKYLTYQWKKDGSDLTGENNSTMTITDANATLHDGNYSVVVSNDFGSVETGMVEVLVSSWSPLLVPGLELWLDAKDFSTFDLSSSSIIQWSDKVAKVTILPI